MTDRKWKWVILTTCMCVLTIFLISGFVFAADSINHPSSVPIVKPSISPSAVPISSSTIRIVGLGDSLTKGYGDSNGNGYVGVVQKQLQKLNAKKKIGLVNFAVNGAKVEDLATQLTKQSGISATLKTSQYVVMTIGANNLRLQGEIVNLNTVATMQNRFEPTLFQLEGVFKQITQINPKIKIIYVGLYNPYQMQDKTGQIGLLIQKWNMSVFETALKYPQVTVIPTYDLFANHATDYLWKDQFHPNAAGYLQMANRISQVMGAMLQ